MDREGRAHPWTPAEHLPAIAVSEATWWRDTASLCAQRMHAGHGQPQQIDARLFVVALHQLSHAAKMAQNLVAPAAQSALRGAGEVPRLRIAHKDLTDARKRFKAAAGDLDHIWGILIHFDEYARDGGRRAKNQRKRGQGTDPATAARESWDFSYDPATSSIRVGPYHVGVQDAHRQARELTFAIFRAVQAIEPPAGPLTA